MVVLVEVEEQYSQHRIPTLHLAELEQEILVELLVLSLQQMVGVIMVELDIKDLIVQDREVVEVEVLVLLVLMLHHYPQVELEEMV